jgi:hypothetical protein
MRKAMGALFAIAVVIFGASIMAQQQPAPAPTGPIPAGLPDWAYTAATGGVAAASHGAPGRRQCGGFNSGDHEDVHTRTASGRKRNDGLVSRGSARDVARDR